MAGCVGSDGSGDDEEKITTMTEAAAAAS